MVTIICNSAEQMLRKLCTQVQIINIKGISTGYGKIYSRLNGSSAGLS